jgi:hypothetical protein
VKPIDSFADFDDSGTELVPEKLQRCGFGESLADAIISQSPDPECQLGFSDTWLNTQRLDKHMPWFDLRWFNIVQTHVTEAVKSQSSHGRGLS